MKRSTIEQIARALNTAGVPFIVTGGLAVVAHGYGRNTQDLGLVIQLAPDSVRRMFNALDTLGYRPAVPVSADVFADPAQRERLVREKGMVVLNFQSNERGDTPIDIFATEPFDFGDEYANALVVEISAGVPMRVLRLEALLRMKEAAGRPQDLADIAELRLIRGGARD